MQFKPDFVSQCFWRLTNFFKSCVCVYTHAEGIIGMAWCIVVVVCSFRWNLHFDIRPMDFFYCFFVGVFFPSFSSNAIFCSNGRPLVFISYEDLFVLTRNSDFFSTSIYITFSHKNVLRWDNKWKTDSPREKMQIYSCTTQRAAHRITSDCLCRTGYVFVSQFYLSI